METEQQEKRAVDYGNFIMRVVTLADQIEYKPGYRLIVNRDQVENGRRLYIQVECERLDTVTHIMGKGRGGKAYLSQHMTNGEIVQIAFGLFKAYEEHECREWFKWQGKRIFGPHIDPEALLEIADRTTYRDKPAAEA